MADEVDALLRESDETLKDARAVIKSTLAQRRATRDMLKRVEAVLAQAPRGYYSRETERLRRARDKIVRNEAAQTRLLVELLEALEREAKL